MYLDVFVQVLPCKLFDVPGVSICVVHLLTPTGHTEKGLNWRYIYLACILDNLTTNFLDFHENKKIFHVITK